jgi:hypothetical protein
VQDERRLLPAGHEDRLGAAGSQPLGRGPQRRPGHRAADVLREFPVVELHELGLGLERAVEARTGEVDQYAATVGAHVGYQVAVELERQRVARQRIGDDEPAAADRLRARPREQLVELVARGRIAQRRAQQQSFTRATIGHVAAAGGGCGHEPTLARELVEQSSQQLAGLPAGEPAQYRHGAEHSGRACDPHALAAGVKMDPLAARPLVLQRHCHHRMRRKHSDRRSWALIQGS